MNEILRNGLPLMQFKNLSSYPTIDHFITTRGGGVSKDGYASLNLSYAAGDEREFVAENRSRVAKAIGTNLSGLIFPSQTHENDICFVDEDTDLVSLQGIDALVTNRPHIAIGVMAADCVPVLLYDKEEKLIAAVHAGWRGTEKQIVKEVIHYMKNEFGAKTKNIIAGIGPSISQRNYEVGETVVSAFQNRFSYAGSLFSKNEKGNACLDLWLANKLQLMGAGVPEQNIELAGLCTYRNNHTFFSARKEQQSGRFGAIIMLKN